MKLEENMSFDDLKERVELNQKEKAVEANKTKNVVDLAKVWADRLLANPEGEVQNFLNIIDYAVEFDNLSSEFRRSFGSDCLSRRGIDENLNSERELNMFVLKVMGYISTNKNVQMPLSVLKQISDHVSQKLYNQIVGLDVCLRGNAKISDTSVSQLNFYHVVLEHIDVLRSFYTNAEYKGLSFAEMQQEEKFARSIGDELRYFSFEDMAHMFVPALEEKTNVLKQKRYDDSITTTIIDEAKAENNNIKRYTDRAREVYNAIQSGNADLSENAKRAIMQSILYYNGHQYSEMYANESITNFLLPNDGMKVREDEEPTK